MNGWSWLMLHHFLNPMKQATAGLIEPLAQHWFTALLTLGVSKSNTSSSHLRLLDSSGRGPPGKTQVVADLGLNHPGNPSASASNGQLQTTSEHQQPAPAQLILQGGWRLVVSCHSQFLKLTGLNKFLPSICQQQPRLNRKEKVYSAHTKGAPWVPPWVIGEARPLDPTGHLLH